MFIRWHVQKKRRSVDNLGDLLVCRLVTSFRNADGKPRHGSVAYLASIRTTMPTNHRIWFWQRVNWKLDELMKEGVIAESNRNAAVSKIAERVPYTSPEQRETWKTYQPPTNPLPT